eukprot:COSAG06_NODE_3718_length_4977_cov_4.743542_5_plen_147_part_00
MCLPAALEMCGDWDRADKYYQRGAEIRQRVLGPAHPLTVAALEQREVRKECVQYIDRFTDSVRPLVVRTVLYCCYLRCAVRFNCDCQACYAQFKAASRVAVSADGGGEREMSEADRLREELRLARAASAAAGRPVEADDSTASSNA